LADISKLSSVFSQVQLFQIFAIYINLTKVWIIKSFNQLNDSTVSRA